MSAAWAPLAAQPSRAPLVESELERIAQTAPLWPGFDPIAIPLAIYDGERTFLFRHPAPPEEFAPRRSRDEESSVYDGRHPLVVANTSVDLGGRVTATLMMSEADSASNVTSIAATAIHEAFHVFQRDRHPGWQANEGNLFVYPTDDQELLRLRLLETEALKRAIAASGRQTAACWARRALDFRTDRFGRMDSVFVAYERETELNEGLAAYVELLAAGADTVSFPSEGFGADEIRERAYVSGPALAFLLDRIYPDWRSSLESDDRQFLDPLLRSAVEHTKAEASCRLSGDETKRINRLARAKVQRLADERSSRRKAFDRLAGRRVIIETPNDAPLWPQGFDPLNVGRVEGGILHERFLRLSNDRAEIEMVRSGDSSMEALSQGVGPHPLFNGVRRLTVAGLSEREVRNDGKQVTIRAPGLTARFEGAELREVGRDVVISWRPQGGK